MSKFLQLHELDNVYVLRNPIVAQELYTIRGQDILSTKDIGFGHKISACFIKKGEKVIKFGIPIGSATEDILLGMHVHLHNLKSDYLPTYTLTDEYIKK